MRKLKQEIYFPIIVGIHFAFWAIDLYFYQGNFTEIASDTMFFGTLENVPHYNPHRILGEVFSSWVVTVFAFNFLMATRARWVEKLFGGLDKMYLIHRRSGIIAVVLLLAHFIVVPRDVVFNPGKPLGFYAFVLIIIGVIISAAPPLKKRIPYHKWINFHKLMGVFYVLAVLHGIMVTSLIQELPIIRIYVFGMAFVGVGAWVYRAFLYGIFNKKLPYQVDQIKYLGNNTTEIILKANKAKLNYKAGQFAFVTFPSLSKREQHPFTISSHPSDSNLRITVKGLGDYTNELPHKLKLGDAASIEGPFGFFTLDNVQSKDQIWIAGGIGITPFLSLLKEVDKNVNVKLYWCVSEKEEAVYANEINAVVNNNPSIEFVLWPSKELGYLNVDKLQLDNYVQNEYLICGPEALKSGLMKGLTQKGVKMSQIHDEEFAFR